MAKAKELVVIPGEVITTEEQYSSGENTYNDNGLIKAKTTGKVLFDDEQKRVRVTGNPVRTLSMGDIVYGKVTLVKESSVMIELKSADHDKKILTPMAMLAVRSISTEFVDDPHALFKIGDLVKAKIVHLSPLGIDLATNETGLGVIKAYCSNCRHPLDHSNGKLICFACGNSEERRWFETEQKARAFTPRHDFGDRPRFGERRSFGDRGASGGRPSYGNRPRFGGRGTGGGRGDFGDSGFGRGPRGNFNKRF